MEAPVKQRSGGGPAALFILVALLLVSMYLLGYATEHLLTAATSPSSVFDSLYLWVLAINAAGVLVLTVLIVVNVLRLLRQHRADVPGSRLTLRMVMMFVLLAVAPVTIVYYFSLQFLQNGIDAWFNVKLEQPLANALKLSQASLDLRKREALDTTTQAAARLVDITDGNAAGALNELRTTTHAQELVLYGKGSRIIAFSSADASLVVPRVPGEDVLLQVRNGSPYVGLEPSREGVNVRVLVVVPGSDRQRLLQARFLIHKRLDRLAESVQRSYADYRKRAIQREPLKYSFSLALSLVLLLSLFAAIWAAFFSARRIVAPVRELAEGTRAVAEGDYSKQLPVSSRDELGFLVESFNVMTRRLAEASDEARRSQQQVEEQRAYLEAVLANLSSGVITLDTGLVVRTINQAAAEILRLDIDQSLGRPFVDLAQQHGRLARLVETLMPHLQHHDRQWREEVVLFGRTGRQILACHGTTLQGREGDHVIVFDDITTLVQAQRDAAWGEVARRLAHEIKNPLTPIQLSAERLRHKFLSGMDEQAAGILDKSTRTIIQQVESMKEMVNAFAEYARAPQIRMQALSLNDVVRGVLELYKGSDSGVVFETDLDPRTPMVEGDEGRLRQLLLNLVKNALEAMEGMSNRRIGITTRCMEEAGCRYVELRIRDHGPGLADIGEEAFFEPYVTTKPKGTGLGLAIVKKIVEEHGGMIWAENVPPEQGGGACFTIRMPVLSAARKEIEQP